jgi:SAM-dependent methyltransferase
VNKILPISIYNRIVEYEADVYSSRIISSYKTDIMNEYLSIAEFLPEPCTSILDIGCGVAGIDVLLNYHYKANQPKFFLLDKTHIEKSVWYGFKTKGAFYNSLDTAKDLLVQNNVPESFIHMVDATENNDINIDCRVDLVISLLSWGFHYPIDTYLEKVLKLLMKSGVLILDVRKNTNGIDLLSDVFSNVDVILDQPKYQRVLVVNYELH